LTCGNTPTPVDYSIQEETTSGQSTGCTEVLDR
jgi:hypothetical protein